MWHRTGSIAVLLIGFLFAGCSGEADRGPSAASLLGLRYAVAGEPAQQVIGASGGVITQGGVCLEIPAGCLATSTTVTLDAGASGGGIWCSIGPALTALDCEVRIRFVKPDPSKTYRIRVYDNIGAGSSLLPSVDEGDRVVGRPIQFGRLDLEEAQ